MTRRYQNKLQIYRSLAAKNSITLQKKKMKAILVTAGIIISLFGTSLRAADSVPVTASAEQQFQQADVQLAIEQYKKLKMAAFEITLKLATEKAQPEEQRVQLNEMRDHLERHAQELRAETVKAAAAAIAKTR